MAETLTVYEAGRTLSKAKGNNYIITAPFTGTQTTLEREIDFGVIPGTKQPSLLKAGAQKIANAFGLLQHYTVESAIEDPTTPVFFYRIRCDLIKIASDGTEYVFTTGHGSANTMESRNGRNSAWNAANSTLKMAEKRALVAAVLSVSGLSNLFSQDLENEDFMKKEDIEVEDPNETISNKKLKRMFAVASSVGLNTSDAKEVIAEHGYTSSKDIKNSDYDDIVEAIRIKGESRNA